MFKRFAPAARINTAILMVVSILVPTSVADAATNITKVVTVIGTDGQPYVGATVTIKHEPASGSIERTTFLNPVTTGSDGVANLTFPDNLPRGTLIVMPRSGDTATATYTNYYNDFSNSNPETITLQKSLAAIHLAKWNGDAIGAGAGIFLLGEFFQLTNSGDVGVAVGADAPAGTCENAEIYPPDTLQDTFYQPYGVKIVGTGTNRSIKFYDDVTSCLQETSAIGGVYQLKFNRANISGNILSNTGQAITFGSGEGYKVQIIGFNQDGTRNFSRIAAGSFSTSDGHWTGFIDTSTAGKFEIIFSGSGGSSFPTFMGNYIYVTSDHKLSWNENGASSASSLTRDFNLPQANFSLKLIDSATSTIITTGFFLTRKIPGTTDYADVGFISQNGAPAAFNFPNGEYRLSVSGNNLEFTSFDFTVSGSTVTVTSNTNLVGGYKLINSGNNFSILKPAPNVKIKFVDANGNNVSAQIQLCTALKVCGFATTDASGFATLTLNDGTYTYVNIDPQNTNLVSALRTTATVTSGSFSITGGTQENDGSWKVILPAANLKLKVLFPNDSPLYRSGGNAQPLGYLTILSADTNWNGNAYVTSPRVNSNGTAAATLTNGRYIIELRLQRSSVTSETDGFADRQFRVTVSDGSLVITSDGTNISADGSGVFTLKPYMANLDILVKDETGTVVDAGDVQIWEEFSNGNRANFRSSGIGQNGHAYFYFTGATGKININPSATYENLGPKTYAMSFGNDSITVVNGENNNGAWVLRTSIPNIRILMKNPITNSAIEDGYIVVESADDSWVATDYVTELPIWPELMGKARTFLGNGKYLFTVNPADSPSNAGLAAQTYRVTVSDAVISMTTSSGVSAEKIGGVFQLAPESSNFDMIIKKINGQVFTNGWVNFCKVIDVKARNCNGRWIHTDGTMGLYLTNGTWEISLEPGNGSSDVTRKTYEVIVTNGIPVVTGVDVGLGNVWTLFMGVPNVSGTLSVESGTLSITNGQNVNFSVQKYINGNWQFQDGNSWTNSTSWAMTLNLSSGKYRLVARPYGFADYVESYSDPIWVDSSGKFALSETGTATTTLSAFNIVLRTPNLKFKVINPLAQPSDLNYLAPGGWISIEKIVGQGRTWVTNADIQLSNPGLTGANVTEPGSYVIRVNPPNGSNAIVGLAAKDYQMTVVSSDSVTVSSGGVAVSKDSNGRFILNLATANVTARILRTDGTPAIQGNNKWVSVNLQKLNTYGDWEWKSWCNTDDNGYVSFRVDEAGKYRLRIEPYGDSQASVTYSSEFTVTAEQVETLDKKYGSITLAGPSIRISVATSSSPSVALTSTNIEIRKDGRWIDWGNTGQSGIAGISLTAEGNYEFVVQPNQELLANAAKKSYKVTATKDSDGKIVAVVTPDSGVSVTGTVTTLLLGTPTLVGTVKDPDGVVAQAGSQVYAVDLASGSEKWDYSVNTNNDGQWSMVLPAGRYKIYARAPWGTSTYGSSNGVGVVEVLANGNVTTPSGYPANQFNIRLKAPTWSGTVKAPIGDTVIPGARVCLLISNIWNCTNADSAGHFALSMPETFISFSSTNPILDIADDQGRNYPMNRIQGETNVSTALNGTSSNTVVLRLKAPNTEITVTPSEGTLVASNLWVVAERDGVGYLGSGTTDLNGVAKLNIDQPNLPFKVRVEVGGNQEIAANFAPTTRSYTQNEITNGTSNSVFHGSISLSPPNFRFIVREPTSAGTPVSNTWVELLGGNEGPWLGGSSVDYNGFGNFKLDVPTSGVNNYTMIVNPSREATTNFTRQAYAVTVAASGTITVTNKTSVTEVRTQIASGKTVYPLALGIPSVTGIVVDPDSHTVSNSFVVPYNAATNEGYWQQGVTTRNDGSIAMNLASGNYKLEANVPWGVSGVAKSAQCAVTVTNGTISTGGSCVQSGTPNTVRLQLRAPNVKFTLKVGTTVIPNANVGVGAGKWWTNAQSDANGVVSLFIDAAAIRDLNGTSASQRLWLWVDPPYGSSIMARWSCGSTDNKPICKDLPDAPASGEYVGKVSDNGSAWVVQGVTPNTRLKIVDPVTSTELANSWVSVMAMNSQGNQWWLGGGNSGIDGYVAMNIETETAFANGFNKLVLEVQAPWDQRTKFATNLYNYGGLGYTYESLTAVTDFSPATPNLKLVIKDSNNYINRYGWVGVEDVTNINATKWVGGYGLNEYGEGAIFLSASKTYRITSYPGPGRGGAATTCLVTTGNQTPPEVTADSAGCGSRTVTNGSLTIRLNGGNVVGTVTRADGTPVVGAAVYANIPGAATEASAVITVTDETGHYDLQLTAGQSWNLKVFPIPSTTDNLEIKTHPTAITAPANGASTIDFTLAAVVG